MHRCLQLARLGGAAVAPNPMVGAVLVYEDRIIGEGYHQYYGGPHAEPNCIEQAMQQQPDKIAESTLYVSLEPCAHHGKTPPCADLIIRHRIPRVVIGCRDRFEQVDGRGIAKLKAAGIEVTVGILESEARELNKAFFTFHQQQRPYIILKWAQTANGFIGGPSDQRLRISDPLTNRKVHQWRSAVAAIMVGANTADQDDPLLDNRHWFGPAPKKILLDPRLRVPPDRRLFHQGTDTLVFNTLKDAIQGAVLYLKVEQDHYLSGVLRELYQHQIQSVLVEGGRMVLQSFIDAGIWDEARVISNPGLILAEGIPAPRLRQGLPIGQEQSAGDFIHYYKNQHNGYINGDTGLLQYD
ncbi:bifunctional diaminohydroxyphosphoribosylaminopyrimidine deaminase/5-amino-6-(5-phosphoribosylamino)uracil reductase RibD [Niabella terrae]